MKLPLSRFCQTYSGRDKGEDWTTSNTVIPYSNFLISNSKLIRNLRQNLCFV